MLVNFIKILMGIGLIIGGLILQVLWLTFLFGSVLGVVLVLIFAPHLFVMPWTMGMVAGMALIGSVDNKTSIAQNIVGENNNTVVGYYDAVDEYAEVVGQKPVDEIIIKRTGKHQDTLDPFCMNSTPYKDALAGNEDIGGSPLPILKGLGVGVLVASGCLFGIIALFLFLFYVFVPDTNDSDPHRNFTSQAELRESPPTQTLPRYHVIARKLNLLNKPENGYVMTELSEFDAVIVYPNTRINGWIEVETESYSGWVEEIYLAPGEG